MLCFALDNFSQEGSLTSFLPFSSSLQYPGELLSEPTQTAIALAGDASRERQWGGADDCSLGFGLCLVQQWALCPVAVEISDLSLRVASAVAALLW
jgi:hypothetical protein